MYIELILINLLKKIIIFWTNNLVIIEDKLRIIINKNLWVFETCLKQSTLSNY